MVNAKIMAAFGLVLLSIIIIGGGMAFYEAEKKAQRVSILDSIYWAVATVTTVGYGDITPKTQTGKYIAMAVMIGGVGTAMFLLTQIAFHALQSTTVNLERRLSSMLGLSRKLNSTIENHIIVCGYGRVGAQVVKELSTQAAPVVVIDIDREKISQNDIPAIRGDAGSENVLKAAGIESAKALIATTTNDATNVFIVLTARKLNPKARIVARANQAENVSIFYSAGAAEVTLADLISGRILAGAGLRPHVMEFLDEILTAGTSIDFENFAITESSPLAGKTVGEINLKSATGITLLSIRRGEKHFHNPALDMKIEKNDVLIGMGTPEQLNRMEKYAERI